MTRFPVLPTNPIPLKLIRAQLFIRIKLPDQPELGVILVCFGNGPIIEISDLPSKRIWLLSVIVPFVLIKTVSYATADSSASRKEPAPVSNVFSTKMTLARELIAPMVIKIRTSAKRNLYKALILNFLVTFLSVTLFFVKEYKISKCFSN